MAKLNSYLDQHSLDLHKLLSNIDTVIDENIGKYEDVSLQGDTVISENSQAIQIPYITL